MARLRCFHFAQAVGYAILGRIITAEAIRAELRTPRPFRLRTADPSPVLVRHPDYVMLSPSGRTLSVFREDDSDEVLAVPLISPTEAAGRRKSR